jgi:translation initiation factor 4B
MENAQPLVSLQIYTQPVRNVNLDYLARYTDRGFAVQQREQLPLPSKPPYTAHLGNLPFDATGLDIEDFFAGCEVSNVRIVEDKLDRKPKGFGYVEFRSLDGLKKALELSGTPFRNRDIRISVADPRELAL